MNVQLRPRQNSFQLPLFHNVSHTETSSWDGSSYTETSSSDGSPWEKNSVDSSTFSGNSAERALARHNSNVAKVISPALRGSIIVDGISMSNGDNALLRGASLKLRPGACHALLGRSACGKTTLLKKIAWGPLPGFPRQSVTVAYLPQVPRKLTGNAADLPPLEYLMLHACGTRRRRLKQEKEALEEMRDNAADAADASDEEGSTSTQEETMHSFIVTERLCEICNELDEIGSEDQAQSLCETMLSHLGFTESVMKMTNVTSLATRWRMRVELLSILIECADIILLDEPTAYLDLRSNYWLANYIVGLRKKRFAPTVVVVSQDRSFLNSVATDVIVHYGQTLTSFRGGMDEYEKLVEEMAATRKEKVIDSVQLQEIEMQKGPASSSPLRAQWSSSRRWRKKKKRLRKVGKLHSFHVGECSLHQTRNMRIRSKSDSNVSPLTHKNAHQAKQEEKISFPTPKYLGVADGSLVSLKDVSIAQMRPLFGCEHLLLDKINVELYPGTRAAVVGDNDRCVTKLLLTIAGMVFPTRGTIETVEGCKIVLVDRNHIDDLTKHSASSDESAADMLVRWTNVGASEVRARLADFGILDRASLTPLVNLSVGELARVSLALLTWHAPDVLLLDEPLIRCDMATMGAMADALSAFPGAVVVSSNNRSFLSQFCNELWVLQKGKLGVSHPPLYDAITDASKAFEGLLSIYAAS